jgi:hypothetical protein
MGIRAFLFIIPLMLLSACDNMFLQTQQYTFVPPRTPAGKICAKQCPVAESQCKRNCEALKNNCLHQTKLNAQQSYLQYVNERMAQGLLVDKTEAQFYQAPQNCGDLQYCQQRCEIGMRACHTHCGGDVLQNGNCLLNCAPKDPEAIEDEGSFF